MSGRSYRDIPYTVDRANGLRLDIFLPEEGEGPFPVAACPEMEENLSPFAAALLEDGYAVAKVRCTPFREQKLPAQLMQCRAAIRFLRAHSQAFALDREHVLLLGEKKGAYLAAMLALTMGSAEFDDLSLGYPNEPDSVQAAILTDGIYDLGAFRMQNPDAAGELFDELFDSRQPEESLLLRMSPFRWAGHDAPPICLFCHEGAGGALLEQMERMKKVLCEKIGERVFSAVLKEGGKKEWYGGFAGVYGFLAQWLP